MFHATKQIIQGDYSKNVCFSFDPFSIFKPVYVNQLPMHPWLSQHDMTITGWVLIQYKDVVSPLYGIPPEWKFIYW